MSKNKKVTRYLHLHRIPFILLWMSTIAIGWGAAFLGVLVLTLIGTLVNMGYWLLGQPMPSLFVGMVVGIVTAFGQPWLVRQRSGMVLRFWRPLSIVSYTVAGIALSPLLLSYNQSTTSLVLAHFLWFAIPAILPALSLRRIVRGAWKWTAAGIGVAALAAATAFVLPGTGGGTWQPFSMLIGTLAQSVISAVVMLRLLKQPHSDTQISNETTANKALAEAEDASRGYLHQGAYVLLWIMTQGVGWMFVFLVLILMWMLSEWVPIINDFYNGLSTPVLATGLALIYGIFTAWAQPWLMRLRTGQVVRNWRPLTIAATTLAGLGSTLLIQAAAGPSSLMAATIASLGLWFVLPTALQMISLRKVGRNIWLWPLSGLASAAVALMILNQAQDMIGVPTDSITSMLLYAVGFGHIVQAMLSGLVSLQILEAPSSENEEANRVVITSAGKKLADPEERPIITGLLSDEAASQRRLADSSS